MDWEFGVNRCKLLALEWISSEICCVALGTMSSHLQWSTVEDKARKIMYICMWEWVAWRYSRKLAEHYKPTIMEKN